MSDFKYLQNSQAFKSYRYILLILLFSILQQSYSQREADRWYFGHNCGLDFSSGEPVVLHNGLINKLAMGCGTICDSMSNLLLYNSYGPIYTSEHTIIENGEDFENYGPGSQSSLIVPWPESDSLYFVFKIESYDIPGGASGLSYNIVDLSENNGLGAVIEKDVELPPARFVNDLLTSARHKNKRDIWIIARDLNQDKYIVFLITPEGLNETAIISPAPALNEQAAPYALMKLSYDKKYLLSLFNRPSARFVEICRFNDETGEIEYLYNHAYDVYPTGLEFSPDSKLVYLSFVRNTGDILIRQYEMQYIEDQNQFSQSGENIGGVIGRGLQLATDGKIYCMTKEDYVSPTTNYYMGVIHSPWEKGLSCNYEETAINMAPGATSAAFPNILADYLFRFDFDGICEGDTFYFTSFFNPIPDSIRWNFNDIAPGSSTISHEINPTHVFSDGGTYEVEVDVWYPSGRFEHTSRMVEVEYAPDPDLGPDTTICDAAEIILNAECGPHDYFWSTGSIGSSQITVSDTGWYWVRVVSNGGCDAIDSIHIAQYFGATADTSNLVLSPTTCGGSTGAIRGLTVNGTPPYSFQWVDDLGNPVANTLNVYHLPVGNYSLHLTDGNSCTTEIGPFSIIDAGDVLVESVDYYPEHCMQTDGSIIVTATSGLGDMLYYSIDNGATYLLNQGQFTDLAGGTYAVRVQDSSLCEDAFANNPIILENTLGPQINNVIITNASIGQNDGAIQILASSPDDTLYFSNDAGLNFQINNGSFPNLMAGFYTCVVADEQGCDTTFVVEVLENFTITLQAMAGDDEVCPGLSAYVPLTVENFDDVAEFNTTLLFDKNSLICQGFANAHPAIEDSLDVLLFPSEGKVELNWKSTPLALPGNTILAELVFETINQSGSIVDWDGSPGASYFLNSTGLSIPVEYSLGEVKLYQELISSIPPEQSFCEGDSIVLYPVIWQSNGPVSFLWSFPNGNTSTSPEIVLNNVQQNQEGVYSLILTDTANCSQQSSVTVAIHESPVPEFTVNDTIFTESPLELDAGSGYISYLWNTGDTTQYCWADTEAWYQVQIESDAGCMGSDSSYIMFKTPDEFIKIYYPNAFTPNGDGLNDEFKVVTTSTEVEIFSLSIFNRWGELLFQTNDINRGWDGKYRGHLCPQGAYVFNVSYQTSNNPQKAIEVKTGTVILVN